MVRDAGRLPCFRDSQHPASCSTRLLGPAAKCHLQCTWSRRSCRVQSKDEAIRKAASAHAGRCTDSCPAAGRRQGPNARSHGATLILPFSLATPVTTAAAAPSERCLSTRNCSRLGLALQRRKHPGTPRYLCWEERAGPCPPAPQLWGETPVPSCFRGFGSCPHAHAREPPVLTALLQLAPRCPFIPGCWVRFLGAGSAFWVAPQGGCFCNCPEENTSSLEHPLYQRVFS